MTCRQELVCQNLRRIGWRCFPLGNIRVCIETLKVEIDIISEGRIVLGEDLVAFFLFNQIIELSELEAAGADNDASGIEDQPPTGFSSYGRIAQSFSIRPTSLRNW